MRTKNICASLVCVVFALVYGFFTTGLPERTLPNTPGPPFFPWILTVFFLILSASWFFNSLKIGDDESIFSEKIEHLFSPAVGLGLFLITLILLPWLGFLLGGIPFFAGLMVVSGERRPLWVIAASIAIPVALYYLFREGFLILLPPGSLLD